MTPTPENKLFPLLALRFRESSLEQDYLAQRLHQAQRFNRTAAWVGMVATMMFILSDLLTEGHLFASLLPYRLAGIGICALILIGCDRLRLSRWLDVLMSICAFAYYLVTSFQVFSFFPLDLASRYVLPSALLCMAAVFGLLDLRLSFRMVTGGSIMLLGIFQEVVYNPTGHYNLPHYFAGLLIGIGGAYLTERYRRLNFYHDREARIAQEKSERLLLNILPAPIADRLRDEHKPLADGFEDVTVLFADIVGFTPMSTQLSPNALLQRLNRIFSEFDSLAEHHGLEKIKTIGDAYMVAGGLPEHQPDHTQRVARLALAIQDSLAAYARELGEPLSLRIGIHQGPVVAGVIGRKKFIYDLWGDTVNTASRMESHGVAGKIQVSERVYDSLKTDFILESRGLVPIKGKGEMRVYFLLGEQSC